MSSLQDRIQRNDFPPIDSRVAVEKMTNHDTITDDDEIPQIQQRGPRTTPTLVERLKASSESFQKEEEVPPPPKGNELVKREHNYIRIAIAAIVTLLVMTQLKPLVGSIFGFLSSLFCNPAQCVSS